VGKEETTRDFEEMKRQGISGAWVTAEHAAKKLVSAASVVKGPGA
jgi:hypothetical protein